MRRIVRKKVGFEMSDEEIVQFEIELKSDLEGFIRHHIDPDMRRGVEALKESEADKE